MKTTKCNLSIACLALVAIFLARPGLLASQNAAANSFLVEKGTSEIGWSVQVAQVDPGNIKLAYSFQMAIYENLIEELRKTKRFQQVFRDGDKNANEVPKLLVLKTTVEKYTPGSETRRAVTTLSGVTKLTVRSQLITRERKVALDRTVNGEVRFFGSNMRATHNLARNIATAIKQSSWIETDQPAVAVTAQP